MAKAKASSFFEIRGTVQGATHVHSKAYGKHIRAPRGTHKPALLNDAMKHSGNALALANLPAKLINDGVKAYRSDFKDGTLWSRLVSVFKKQIAESKTFHFKALEGFEIHKQHPLTAITTITATAQIEATLNLLHVTINIDKAPQFTRVKSIDAYKLSVVVLFPSPAARHCATEFYQLPIEKLEHPNTITHHHLSIPLVPDADSALVCVKIEGYADNQLSNNQRAKGMQVVKVVALSKPD